MSVIVAALVIAGCINDKFTDGKAMLYSGEKLRLSRAEVKNGIAGTYTQVAEVSTLSNNPSHTFTDNTVTKDRAYSYRVQVVDKTGNRVMSNLNQEKYGLTIIPDTPVVAGTSSSRTSTVTWDATAAGTSTNLYVLEREVSRSNGSVFSDVLPSSSVTYSYDGTKGKMQESIYSSSYPQSGDKIRYRIKTYRVGNTPQPVNAAWSEPVTIQ